MGTPNVCAMGCIVCEIRSDVVRSKRKMQHIPCSCLHFLVYSTCVSIAHYDVVTLLSFTQKGMRGKGNGGILRSAWTRDNVQIKKQKLWGSRPYRTMQESNNKSAGIQLQFLFLDHSQGKKAYLLEKKHAIGKSQAYPTGGLHKAKFFMIDQVGVVSFPPYLHRFSLHHSHLLSSCFKICVENDKVWSHLVLFVWDLCEI